MPDTLLTQCCDEHTLTHTHTHIDTHTHTQTLTLTHAASTAERPVKHNRALRPPTRSLPRTHHTHTRTHTHTHTHTHTRTHTHIHTQTQYRPYTTCKPAKLYASINSVVTLL